MPELRVVRANSECDLNAPNANMYGCQPCPKCGSKFRCRFNNAPQIISCDDCGHEERMTRNVDAERDA